MNHNNRSIGEYQLYLLSVIITPFINVYVKPFAVDSDMCFSNLYFVSNTVLLHAVKAKIAVIIIIAIIVILMFFIVTLLKIFEPREGNLICNIGVFRSSVIRTSSVELGLTDYVRYI